MSKAIDIIFNITVLVICGYAGVINLMAHPAWSEGFLLGGLFPVVIAIFAAGFLSCAAARPE